eukprot:6292-Heterococcus_DN1.PRE.1
MPDLSQVPAPAHAIRVRVLIVDSSSSAWQHTESVLVKPSAATAAAYKERAGCSCTQQPS